MNWWQAQGLPGGCDEQQGGMSYPVATAGFMIASVCKDYSAQGASAYVPVDQEFVREDPVVQVAHLTWQKFLVGDKLLECIAPYVCLQGSASKVETIRTLLFQHIILSAIRDALMVAKAPR